jgi:hypothetical protein
MVGKSLSLVEVTGSHHHPTIPAPDTVGRLAAGLGCARRRIAKWREQGAPANLDLVLWRSWLARHARRRYVDACDRLLVEAGMQATEAPKGAPTQTPAALAPTLPADPTAADVERHWRAVRAERQAQLADIELAERQRRLVPTDAARAACRAIIDGTMSALGDRIWIALLPEFDGLDASMRRRLRARHDAAVSELREHLRGELRRILTETLETKR